MASPRDSNVCPNCSNIKAMTAYCAKAYYESLSPERRQLMRDKQRIQKKERYTNDLEFCKKTKTYQREYKRRQKAERAAKNTENV